MIISIFLTVAGSMLASHGRRIGILFAVVGIIGAGAIALKGGAL